MTPSTPTILRASLALLAALAAAAPAVAVEPAAAPPAVAEAPAPACLEGTRPLAGGRFTLADGSAAADVAPYCLDASEVTAARYATCVQAGACGAEKLGCSNAATYGKAGKGDHPINCVSWEEAETFCRWDGKRLPTEAEWEWAARGQAHGRRYPWGEEPPEKRACWDGKGSELGAGGRSGPCAVGTHPAGDSPDGLHDLAGNVREWTATGDDHERVIRGGSWGDSLDWFLAAGFRGFNHPQERFELTGFRCASAPLASPAPSTATSTPPPRAGPAPR